MVVVIEYAGLGFVVLALFIGHYLHSLVIPFLLLSNTILIEVLRVLETLLWVEYWGKVGREV